MEDFFKNKRVLVTGHTGFKGSWLTHYLLKCGAKICGISLKPHTKPSIFLSSQLVNKVENHFVDIKNQKKIIKIFQNFNPHIVFHLAAQPLVTLSYNDPSLTFATNVMGTLNILEALKKINNCVAILITSDKCYENLEWLYGYRETDRLGGSDPYSASKASVELLISSYVRSFFIKNKSVKIGIARAGNVIGGGDWSDNRIVPDCIKAWTSNKSVNIQNPFATRPWQHVLEPINAYMKFAFLLSEKDELHGEPINFGPSSNNEFTVGELVKKLNEHWGIKSKVKILNKSNNIKEAKFLKLNCDKASSILNWKSKLSFNQTIKITAHWYKQFYYDKINATDLINNDIDFFNSLNV